MIELQMNPLTTFAFILETTLASVALGALWLSPTPLMVKVSITCLLLLVAVSIDMHGIERSKYAELQAELSELNFRFIEAKLDGAQDTPLNVLYAEFAKQQRIQLIASGSGLGYVWMLLGKYAIWLVGGSIAMHFLLPPLVTASSKW